MTLRVLFSTVGIVLFAGCSAGPRLAESSDLAITDRSERLDNELRTGKTFGITGASETSDSRRQPVDRQAGSTSVSPIFDLNSLHGLVLGARFTRTSGERDGALSAGGSVSLSTWGLWGFVGYEKKGLIGGLDAAVRVEGQTSGRLHRVYGLGNDTPYLETDSAGLAFPRAELTSSLGMTLEGGLSWRAGGTLRYVNLGSPYPADVAPDQNALPPEDFAPHTHAGGFLDLRWTRAEGGAFPTRGFRIEGRGDLRAALVDSAGTYGALAGNGTLYLPISTRQPVVLALRIGGEHRLGDFPIYDAATVGGNTLRRFYGNRFAGQTAAYGNAELRFRLTTIEIFPIPLDLGALAFADVGRVWVENDASELWHVGGGGGLWLGLMHELVGQGTLYKTEDGLGLTAGLGFRF